MRILFVHQNFPGQFLHLAPALAKRGHEVLGFGAQANERPSPVPVLRYRDPEPVKPFGLGTTYAEMVARGLATARGAAALREKRGFTPDVIFGSIGWGETLFLREVFPNARYLAHAEFFYRPTGYDVDFDPEFQKDSIERRISVVTRQAHLLQGMELADAAVAPTQFQASTFPDWAKRKLTVIHEGVDTARMAPDPQATFKLPDGRVLKHGDEVLSFVNRNIEPYRGAHIFLRALPAVLAARPQAQVVIVGGDGVSYGTSPAGGGSWKDWLLKELGGKLDLGRVHFVGRIPYPDYMSLMKVTRAHAYLTYPFVLSWSMLEAMAAGAHVIGSATAPVMEAITDGVEGQLVDFFDIAGWSDALIEALAEPRRFDAMRHAARAKVMRTYDLQEVCLPKLVDFVESA